MPGRVYFRGGAGEGEEERERETEKEQKKYVLNNSVFLS